MGWYAFGAAAAIRAMSTPVGHVHGTEGHGAAVGGVEGHGGDGCGTHGAEAGSWVQSSRCGKVSWVCSRLNPKISLKWKGDPIPEPRAGLAANPVDKARRLPEPERIIAAGAHCT